MFGRRLYKSIAASTNKASKILFNKATTKRTNMNIVEAADNGDGARFAFGLLFGLSAGAGLGYFFIPTLVSEIQKHKEDQETRVVTAREMFERYADVQKPNNDGTTSTLYMTPQAFIHSLVLPRPQAPAWVAYKRKAGSLAVEHDMANDSKLRKLFAFADSDGDGQISFEEYCLFLTLLSCSEDQFRIAFKMFDLDGNGSIDKHEFVQMITANQKQDSKLANEPVQLKGLVDHFYSNENKLLTFDEFFGFVSDLKDQILFQEFNLRDMDRQGAIPVEAFSELVTNSVHFNSLRVPDFKRQVALLKTKGFFAPSGKVDFETFRAFHLMSQQLDDIGVAIKLYAASGKPLNQIVFKRVLERVAGLKVSNRVVDLVFAIYDKDGNGTLDLNEFIETMKIRNNSETYNVTIKV